MINNPFVSLLGIFVAALATLQAGSPPSFDFVQVGAVANSQKIGSCQRTYDQCIATVRKTGRNCEADWKACVTKKCDVIKISSGIKQCTKDPDCETSCTEWATSKEGLRSCCLGGPEHKNFCRKDIDNICNPGTPKAFTLFPGPQYNEGDVVPPKQSLSSIDVDSAFVMQPFAPSRYPEGTKFNDAGIPSNPPLDNPTTYPLIEIPPEKGLFPAFPSNQVPEYVHQLPPEYQPSEPYQVPRSANAYLEALTFNDSYLSTQSAMPPSGLNDTLFNSEVMAPPSDAFDYNFRAEPNDLSLVSVVPRPASAVPLSTFSQTPSSISQTDMSVPIQSLSPFQRFLGRVTSIFGF